ncbi:MAG: hypothetical protein GVY20_10295 [Bacteroidetes bacterium]|jgi:trigger factor|nr:hypothetical protein [Bacteroidota bacterium]
MKSNILDQSQYLAKVEITIEAEDYFQELNNRLKERRKSTNMKGFRPGKAPMRLIQRMYGKSLLVDIINNKASEYLSEVTEEHNWRPLGEIDLAEEQENLDFDSTKEKDYSFLFDVVLLPSIDLKGLDGSLTVPYFSIEVNEEDVQEKWDELLSQVGEQVETEGPVEEGDVVTLEASELEGDSEKENGWISNFSIAHDLMTEEAADLLLGSNLGDTFDFNIYKLEKETDPEFVEKHLLKLDDDEKPEISPMFRFEVMTIKTKKEAELNQATFDKIFGENEVKSESEALDKIRSGMEQANQGASDNLFYWESKFKLVELNKLEDMPEDYIKKHLLDEKTAEKFKDENVPETVKDELNWSLISQNISIQNDLNPTQDAIVEKAQERIRQMLQGQQLPDSVMSQLTKTILEDEKEVRKITQEVAQNMITEFIKDNVTLNVQTVDDDGFKKEVDRINDKVDEINKYLDHKSDEEE